MAVSSHYKERLPLSVLCWRFKLLRPALFSLNSGTFAFFLFTYPPTYTGEREFCSRLKNSPEQKYIATSLNIFRVLFVTSC